MAYTLQAIIGVLSHLRERETTARVLPLDQGLGLLPLSQTVLEARGIPFLPLTDEGRTELPETIAALCRDLSEDGLIAYVEAEYFGGNGTQAAVLFERGRQVAPHEVSGEAINVALRSLGVRASTSDEFDAVGLSLHRDTEDWLGNGERDRR